MYKLLIKRTHKRDTNIQRRNKATEMERIRAVGGAGLGGCVRSWLLLLQVTLYATAQCHAMEMPIELMNMIAALHTPMVEHHGDQQPQFDLTDASDMLTMNDVVDDVAGIDVGGSSDGGEAFMPPPGAAPTATVGANNKLIAGNGNGNGNVELLHGAYVDVAKNNNQLYQAPHQYVKSSAYDKHQTAKQHAHGDGGVVMTRQCSVPITTKLQGICKRLAIGSSACVAGDHIDLLSDDCK